jgi:hypothetical protein
VRNLQRRSKKNSKCHIDFNIFINHQALLAFIDLTAIVEARELWFSHANGPMNSRGARGRPNSHYNQSRLLYISVGFVFGAIISTVIQNISDAHLELYHGSQAQVQSNYLQGIDVTAAR